MQPAGLELFDISVPDKPRSISFFDCSGSHSRGVHQLWFCDGEFVHMASGAPDFTPSHPLDDQFYRCIDVRNPSKPVEVGRWWMPGTSATDNVKPPPRHPLDKGYRAHNTNVYPQRGDRLYLCYIDGGMFVMDIADKANPKVISHWTNSPPYTGFMHTAVPLFDRNLMLVTDELTEDNAADWPKLIWVLDARDEQHLVPISTCPLPPVDAYKDRGGRFGAHNIHENVPVPTSFQSDQIVLGTFFNGGLRAYDIANPYQPKEVAAFVPPAPNGSTDRRDPAQRRLCRRAAGGLHGRSVFGRALCAGDGFLGRYPRAGIASFPFIPAEAGIRPKDWVPATAGTNGDMDSVEFAMNSPFPPPPPANSAASRTARAARKIPVTVITGFLGAGKTTLLEAFP